VGRPHGAGRAGIRHVTNHTLGVIDFYLSMAPGVEAAAHSRVLPNVGRVDPENLVFASQRNGTTRHLPVLEEIGEMETLHEIAGVFQRQPDYDAPERVVNDVRQLIESGQFRVLA
jgi:hypothetical protein